MENRNGKQRNLYSRRLKKEKEITEEEINRRMRWDLPVLSQNQKCSVSLDLPLLNCTPTSVCASVCYAAQGRQYYRRSVIKSLAIDRMIQQDCERVAQKMVDESAGRAIRIAGSGEILPRHADLLSYVERYGGNWWGFTRRIDTHKVLPRLMFSIDRTTPQATMQYVREQVPVSRRAYLRRPRDPPSSLEVAVTFPVHGPVTKYENMIEAHETDCPADRKQVRGCWDCKRCYSA